MVRVLLSSFIYTCTLRGLTDGRAHRDTSNAPTQITNGLGRVVLQRGCATQGESCVTVGTLASGFNITDGTVEIEVPMTLPNEDYFIVCEHHLL